MKPFLRYTVRVILSVVLILIILPFLLYIPALQRFAKDKAASVLSEKTGWQINIDRFDLRFPLKLQLSGVDGITQKGDTLFHLSSFRTGIAFMPLLKGKVVVAELAVRDLSSDMEGLIEGIDLVGKVGNLTLKDIDVSLKNQVGDVKDILLANTRVRMRITPSSKDTVKSESTPLNWKFRIGQLNVNNAGYALKMEESGFDLNCLIGQGSIRQGNLSLGENIYKAASLDIRKSSYAMDLDTLPQKNGFDPAHMAMRDIRISADSIYNQGTTVSARIKNASFKEQSGLELTSLKGSYAMDSVFMKVSGFKLVTPNSHLSLDARWDQSVFAKPRRGKIKALLDGKIGKQDILYFISAYAPDADKVYPDHDLMLNTDINGDMRRLDIRSFNISLPTAFNIESTGFFNKLNDEKNTSAEVKLEGDLENLSFIPLLLPDTALRHQLAIPKKISINGNLFAEVGQYTGKVSLAFGHSELSVNGSYYPVEEKYTVQLDADSMAINKFLPYAGFGTLTMQAKASGAGFDPFSAATYADVNAGVTRFDVSQYRIESLKLNAALNKSHYDLSLIGSDTILNMNLLLKGLLTKQEVTANLTANLNRIDLYNLKVLDSEKIIAANIEANASTNLKDTYHLDAQVNDMRLRDRGILNKLGNLALTSSVEPDSIRLAVRNGDLQLKVDIDTGLDSLLQAVKQSTAILDKQMKEREVDIRQLQALFPDMVMQFEAGTQNALYGYFKSTGFRYKKIDLLLTSEKKDGIRLNGLVNDLRKDTLLLNTVNLDITQAGEQFNYQITGNSKNQNPARAFRAKASGILEKNKISLDLLYKNGKDQTGLDLGLIFEVSQKEMKLHFEPYDPVILYRKWTLNPNNFIALTSEKHMLADFILTGEKGMQLSLQSRDTLLQEGKSDLDVALKNFQISQISEVLPNLPPFSGRFNAGINVSFDKEQMDAKGLVTLDTLYYNKRLMGDLALDLNYESSKAIGQWVYASVDLDKQKILEGDVNLNAHDSVSMAANMFLYALPLKLADPFIPDAMASLVGTASGEIMMEEIGKQPFISGKLDLDSAAVTVSYANATYKLDEQPMIIKNNKLEFHNYSIMAYNKNPLLLNGEFNFTDFNRMVADLSITGDNVELLNVPKQRNQMIYGRLMMNVNTTVKGPVELLTVRGNINLLTGTRVNYVMLDSPVSAQNRVSNLVTFTSFNDTIDSNYQIKNNAAALSGINMLVTVNIAPTVQVGIDLSTNGDDRVELQGGGDLAFRLTPMGETDLSGRYSLSGGFVRYNLPILPVAKTFNIRNGSYVEWSGKLMDPYINITASETIRSTVTEEGKGTRVVVFEPLIEIRNRLDNLSIQFTVEAPDDISIQNQLAQMTAEERSRQAMNLIITQAYTGPGTTSKANTNNALNAFIQKEINSFAGSALKGVDLSVGIDTYDQYGAEGSSGKRTDYSFRFSKRLFNDRFRIVVGGKVSSGQEAADEQQQNFIDDVTLEYMLDKSGTRYLKLFHHTGFESVLEGEIVETGIGAVLKRRVRKVRQLFIFNEKRRQRAIETEPKEENSKNVTK